MPNAPTLLHRTYHNPGNHGEFTDFPVNVNVPTGTTLLLALCGSEAHRLYTELEIDNNLFTEAVATQGGTNEWDQRSAQIFYYVDPPTGSSVEFWVGWSGDWTHHMVELWAFDDSWSWATPILGDTLADRDDTGSGDSVGGTLTAEAANSMLAAVHWSGNSPSAFTDNSTPALTQLEEHTGEGAEGATYWREDAGAAGSKTLDLEANAADEMAMVAAEFLTEASGETRAIAGDADINVALDGDVRRKKAIAGNVGIDVALGGDVRRTKAIGGNADITVQPGGHLGVLKRIGGNAGIDVELGGAIEAPNTFSTNFEEYPSDQPPSDWTQRWVTSNVTWAVRDVVSPVGQKVLRAEVTSDARHGLSWDAVGDHADCNLVMMLRVDATITTNTNHVSLVARGAGAAGAEDGYAFGPWEVSGDPWVVRTEYDNGALEAIGNVTAGFEVDTWYLLRADIAGDACAIKMWEPNDPEPATYDTTPPADGITAAGWLGVLAFLTGTYDIAWVSVGLNGQDAPLPEHDVSIGGNVDIDVALAGELVQVRFEEDFTEQTVDQAPAGLTPLWEDTGVTYTVRATPDNPLGNPNVLEVEVTSPGTKVLGLDAAGTPDDVEVVVLLRTLDDEGTLNHNGAAARASGDGSTRNGYVAATQRHDPEELNLAKWTSNTGQFISEDNVFEHEIGEWVYVLMRASATTLQVKGWKLGEEVPASWLIDTTDSDHASGAVGLFTFTAGTHEVAWIGVGVDGEDAPLPAEVLVIDGGLDVTVDFGGQVGARRALAGDTSVQVSPSGALAKRGPIRGSMDIAVEFDGQLGDYLGTGDLPVQLAFAGALQPFTRVIGGAVDISLAYEGHLTGSVHFTADAPVDVTFSGDVRRIPQFTPLPPPGPGSFAHDSIPPGTARKR